MKKKFLDGVFLVLVFSASVFLLFLLKIEFIFLLFILVYVGAIAVVFFFVVMMLDIKKINFEKDFLVYLPMGSFLGIIFFMEVFLTFLFFLFFNSWYYFTCCHGGGHCVDSQF
jgi:NADH-quinone oxidoreductase subunit J